MKCSDHQQYKNHSIVWILNIRAVPDVIPCHLCRQLLVLNNFSCLTLSAPHATIVAFSWFGQKVPSQELLSATEFNVRLV